MVAIPIHCLTCSLDRPHNFWYCVRGGFISYSVCCSNFLNDDLAQLGYLRRGIFPEAAHVPLLQPRIEKCLPVWHHAGQGVQAHATTESTFGRYNGIVKRSRKRSIESTVFVKALI